MSTFLKFLSTPFELFRNVATSPPVVSAVKNYLLITGGLGAVASILTTHQINGDLNSLVCHLKRKEYERKMEREGLVFDYVETNPRPFQVMSYVFDVIPGIISGWLAIPIGLCLFLGDIDISENGGPVFISKPKNKESEETNREEPIWRVFQRRGSQMTN